MVAGFSNRTRKLAAMNVVVCVKQIPDPAEPGALDADFTLKRDGKLILDESDSYGVEMALQLVDPAGGGEVTFVSMAPNDEITGLRTALAMGAAKAILVSDDALSGAGALDTAKVLADGHRAGRVRPRLRRHRVERRVHRHRSRADRRAARPPVGDLRQAHRDRRQRRVERQTEAGYDDVECPLPAVVSVTAGVVEPRYPSFKGIMAAKSKPVDQVTVADLGIDPATWGGPARVRDRRGGAGPGPPGRRDHRRRRRSPRPHRGVPRKLKVI